MDKTNSLPLRYGNRLFLVRPDFLLVREVEDELGSLPALQEKFSHNRWCVADLVTLTQMLLQAVGQTVDYVLLGNTMLREGLQHYLAAAQVFFDMVLYTE